MRWLIRCFVTGVVSTFVALSARATSGDPGTVLVAPQLVVSGSGPVTATFLGSSAPFAQMFFAWDSSAAGFFFGPGTALGATFQESPQQTPLNPFGPGSEVTFAALFGTPATSPAVLSATRATPSVASLLAAPVMSEPAPGFVFNAGVIEGASGRLLVGFNPAGASLPSGFEGFAVRISLSNVCVK